MSKIMLEEGGELTCPAQFVIAALQHQVVLVYRVISGWWRKTRHCPEKQQAVDWCTFIERTDLLFK